MKIHGKKIQTLNTEVVVIPRSNGEEYVFRAQAVLDFSEFEELAPPPKPKIRTYPDGRKEASPDDNFKDRLEEWQILRLHWMVLKSLEATDGLEWESVDMTKPDTFENYEKELVSAGFTHAEVNMIVKVVTEANSLSSYRS